MRRISESRTAKLSKMTKPINLVPIMNLFLVVIPFLLMIMVTAQMALLEIQLASSGGGDGAGNEGEEEIKEISVAIFDDRLEVKLSNQDKADVLPVIAEGIEDIMQRYDFTELDRMFQNFDEEFPVSDSLKQITGLDLHEALVRIIPSEIVKYQALLLVIDICKMNNFPNIRYSSATTKLLKRN
ncbi:MAG: biopolymer transporter ExbD [Candidatus Cloacimonetes bacterium]|nr:biopolymer transporter ExbD [Candidatus Cloacimonadota bacterium]